MKTTFSGFLLVIAAALTSISPVAAQSTFAKQGDVAFSGVFHSMSHNVSMGEDVEQYSYEAMGGLLAEKEGTLPDRLSVRCVGGGRLVKGTLEGETGMCEYVDLSGEKLFTTTSSTKGEIPGTVVTKHTVAGGTASTLVLRAGGLASDAHCGLLLRDRGLRWSPTRAATNCLSASAYWSAYSCLLCG